MGEMSLTADPQSFSNSFHCRAVKGCNTTLIEVPTQKWVAKALPMGCVDPAEGRTKMSVSCLIAKD